MMRTSEPQFTLDFIEEMHYVLPPCCYDALVCVGVRSETLEQEITMSVRRRQWVSPMGEPKEAWIVDYATSTATGTSRPSPRNATPMPITPSSASPSAPEPIPPTARASPSPRRPSYGWQLRCRRVGAHNARRLSPARRAAHRADTGSAASSRSSPSRWCAASRTGCAARLLAGDGAQVPPLARLARSPTPRSAASWRRTSCARCARPGAVRGAHERRRNGKLKVGVDIPAPDEMRAIVAALPTIERAARWRPLLLTAIFTGLRASELRGLDGATSI